MTHGAWDHQCHVGATKVMTIGEAEIWAGRWAEMEKHKGWDLRIRMNDSWGMRSYVPLVVATPEAEDILGTELTKVKAAPSITIDWDDYGVPELDAKWWETLVHRLELAGPIKVAVYCQGGHGRTGTVLAILALLSKQDIVDGDVVDWVRDVYCEETVESWSQIDYIEQITNTMLVSEPTSAIKAKAKMHTGAPYGSGTVVNTGYQVGFNNPSEVTPLPTAQTTMFDKDKKLTPQAKAYLSRKKIKRLAKRGAKENEWR